VSTGVGFWNDGYGTHWLAEGGDVAKGKCHQLLEAGANEIWLPRSGGSSNRGDNAVEKMLAEYDNADSSGLLEVKAISSLGQNPLWVASNAPHLQRVFIKEKRGDNSTQTEKYLHPAHPFLKISRGASVPETKRLRPRGAPKPPPPSSQVPVKQKRAGVRKCPTCGKPVDTQSRAKYCPRKCKDKMSNGKRLPGMRRADNKRQNGKRKKEQRALEYENWKKKQGQR
jgi:hypothetical protein